MENKKKEVIILKPNTLRSKNSSPLKINEQRILFYSIYKIQKSSTSVSFTKAELEERFGINFGTFKDISKYLSNLRNFGMDVMNEETNQIILTNAFSQLVYDNGLFLFRFNENFLPSIDRQKRFLQFGMAGISSFKCRYTIYLYDYLKDMMWGDITVKKNLSLGEFRDIFKLDPKKHTANKNFRTRVWYPAMEEINEYTDYQISIKAEGRGNTMRFSIYRLVNEDFTAKDSVSNGYEFKCSLGKNLIDFQCSQCMKINKCPYGVDDEFYRANPDRPVSYRLRFFMENTLFVNKYYSLETRINNKCASHLELGYYNMLMEIERESRIYSGDYDTPISVEEALQRERKAFKEHIIDVKEDGKSRQ